MQIEREWLETLIFGDPSSRRFTQDSTIMADVWMEYGFAENKPVSLLLTPYDRVLPGSLGSRILTRLGIHSRSREKLSPDIQLAEPFGTTLDEMGGSTVTPSYEDYSLRLDSRVAGALGPLVADYRLAYNKTSVVMDLNFSELLHCVLPLSWWWTHNVSPLTFDQLIRVFLELRRVIREVFPDNRRTMNLRETALKWAEVQSITVRDVNRILADDFLRTAVTSGRPSKAPKIAVDLIWMIRLLGTMGVALQNSRFRGRLSRSGPSRAQRDLAWNDLLRNPERAIEYMEAVGEELRRTEMLPSDGVAALLWSVNINRPATVSVWRSTRAVKADAAQRVFDASCKDITWAIVDSGIDATHGAFRLRQGVSGGAIPYGEPFEYVTDNSGKSRLVNRTRVVATYDFTRIRDLIQYNGAIKQPIPPALAARLQCQPELSRPLLGQMGELRKSLLRGQEIDWSLLAPLLEIPHDPRPGLYQPPRHDHGTHVAGILGADWDPSLNDKSDDEPVRGMCPDIKLYDLRVLNENGGGDEFSIMAALQFLRYLNSHKDFTVIHGVNLSLSIRHDVANYACGRTPICQECDRLMNSGIVVVAAAGNEGYLEFMTTPGKNATGYRNISITDPGNAESVITVGATHRTSPHTYGVSYFSSRGPTGDGRRKPDLVAPGEKIESTVPGDGLKRMDGTSMAAPHVSGAAAMLMARHTELSGEPARVKEILCSSATCLGRDHYFQGHGMVDILRALQSV